MKFTTSAWVWIGLGYQHHIFYKLGHYQVSGIRIIDHRVLGGISLFHHKIIPQNNQIHHLTEYKRDEPASWSPVCAMARWKEGPHMCSAMSIVSMQVVYFCKFYIFASHLHEALLTIWSKSLSYTDTFLLTLLFTNHGKPNSASSLFSWAWFW